MFRSYIALHLSFCPNIKCLSFLYHLGHRVFFFCLCLLLSKRLNSMLRSSLWDKLPIWNLLSFTIPILLYLTPILGQYTVQCCVYRIYSWVSGFTIFTSRSLSLSFSVYSHSLLDMFLFQTICPYQPMTIPESWGSI